MRALFLLAVLPLVSGVAASPAPIYEDVAAAMGLDFVHAGYRAGPGRELAAFYEATAGGACWGDFDSDGWVDVYLTDFLDPSGAGRSRLYRNLEGARFEDVTDAQGVGLRAVAQACVWGDFDNDGWPDLYVTTARTPYSSVPSTLYRNLGEGRGFEDVTARAGVGGDATPGSGSAPCGPVERVDGVPLARCWNVGAAWLDFDDDGDLDLYVASYAQFPFGTCVHEFRGNPVYCLGQHNRLYRNEGDGTFTDVGARAGVDVNGQATLGRSLGVVANDVDGDGLVDVYVANDKDANALYLNAGNGTFRSVAAAMGVDNHGPMEGGVQDHRAGMGVEAQDLDGDGRVDLASTHLRGEYDAIYLQREGGWRDAARDLGYGKKVAFDTSRWGIAFVDVDMDADHDVVVVAGGQARTEPGAIHLLLQDEGRLHWQPAETWTWAEKEQANHRGLFAADVDNDGDVDLLVTSLPSWQGPDPAVKLLRSQAADRSDARWLRVSLEGTDTARDAIGAKVTLRLEDGREIHRWRISGGSYAGDHDPRLLFAWGNATRGEIVVTWPGGRSQGPLPFDLGEARGKEVRIVQTSERPPAPVARAEAAPTPEGVRLSWPASIAADFASYRVYSGDAIVAELADRAATEVLVAAGSAWRVHVVDAGGLESAATFVAEAGRNVPAGGVPPLVILMGVLGATLRRSLRPRP